MFQFLISQSFWLGYLVSAVLLVGVFFCVIGFHEWYKNWDDSDFPGGLIRIFAALFFAAIFPITLVFYASMLVSTAIRKKLEHKEAAPPKSQVRCYQCSHLIGLSDSFCSLCGADQTQLKKG